MLHGPIAGTPVELDPGVEVEYAGGVGRGAAASEFGHVRAVAGVQRNVGSVADPERIDAAALDVGVDLDLLARRVLLQVDERRDRRVVIQPARQLTEVDVVADAAPRPEDMRAHVDLWARRGLHAHQVLGDIAERSTVGRDVEQVLALVRLERELAHRLHASRLVVAQPEPKDLPLNVAPRVGAHHGPGERSRLPAEGRLWDAVCPLRRGTALQQPGRPIGLIDKEAGGLGADLEVPVDLGDLGDADRVVGAILDPMEQLMRQHLPLERNVPVDGVPAWQMDLGVLDVGRAEAWVCRPRSRRLENVRRLRLDDDAQRVCLGGRPLEAGSGVDAHDRGQSIQECPHLRVLVGQHVHAGFHGDRVGGIPAFRLRIDGRAARSRRGGRARSRRYGRGRGCRGGDCPELLPRH